MSKNNIILILDTLSSFQFTDLKNHKPYKDVSNKLKIKNVLVSDFESREHLLECLVASSLVPGWAGYKSRVINGKKYVDGGLTMNLPNIYPNQTIRIQPFSTSKNHAEISPLLTNEKDKNRMIAKMAMVLLSNMIFNRTVGDRTFRLVSRGQMVSRVAPYRPAF